METSIERLPIYNPDLQSDQSIMPWDDMTGMATAFGVFANQGYRVDLHPILKVVNGKGKILEEYTPPDSPIFGKRVLPSEVTFIISDILADNKARLTEFGPSSELVIPKQ